ncbi:MAG: hypothetical protein V4659_02920 [Pseudomonadota bacterium]
MAWAALAVIAGATAALLWRLRLPPSLGSFAAAALTLGAAGYVWQGRPGLAGRLVGPSAATALPDTEVYALREAMLGRFGPDAGYVAAADAMARAGAPGAAVRAVQGGIGKYPTSLRLWIEFGLTLAAHDRAVSPAAELAFRHAVTLAPNDPAPWFFWGLADIRTGDFAAARPKWQRALQRAPDAAGYRRDIVQRLALLERYLATR